MFTLSKPLHIVTDWDGKNLLEAKHEQLFIRTITHKVISSANSEWYSQDGDGRIPVHQTREHIKVQRRWQQNMFSSRRVQRGQRGRSRGHIFIGSKASEEGNATSALFSLRKTGLIILIHFIFGPELKDIFVSSQQFEAACYDADIMSF